MVNKADILECVEEGERILWYAVFYWQNAELFIQGGVVSKYRSKRPLAIMNRLQMDLKGTMRRVG